MPMPVVVVINWVLGIILAIFTLIFLVRIVLTWYPQINLTQGPLKVIYWLSEPVLAPTRRVVPPLGGVDISPIIWVGIVTLLRELLVGQQGLLFILFPPV
ncbi:YggT family protein [Thermosynechococcus sp. GLH187]|nr:MULTISPECIES: YggT family protein [unclassified Thermosynechococcus]WKT81714.1 YggT family protein [Thermosynechococcus sp. PP45]WNC22766.1 YggT family protein [Thermosynechococcus sp. PP22]WNC25325.1 YggT family protein [Thermosynechococcus sp. PP551]WNC27903.1 YggT family protein [Thermosynechococcus sp. PP555]WNC33012.1 YggT family protein [Thermosynechococcus sp. PKX95]WNC35538.1 YggT family protein [Thermosynechococcus sp. PKX91]WNC38058.1 YggT family protein [Thermosynechococcus sp.